jgi:hypothetical protein
VTATDTPEQTKAILLALAREPQPEDLRPWHALQQWLEQGPSQVAIPYATDLVSAIPPVDVRLRRDVWALLQLIAAHALLHQATRERDASGRVVATLDDYAVVRGLVADLLAEGVEASIPAVVRQTVEAVARLSAHHPDGVSIKELAATLHIDKSSASRRVRAAGGYLKNLEEKRGKRARLIPGDPLPEDQQLLPPPQALADRCTVAPATPPLEHPRGRALGQPTLSPSETNGRTAGSPASALADSDIDRLLSTWGRELDRRLLADTEQAQLAGLYALYELAYGVRTSCPICRRCGQLVLLWANWTINEDDFLCADCLREAAQSQVIDPLTFEIPEEWRRG